MVCESSGIITDNDWSSFYYQSLCSDISVYDYPLPVSQEFLNRKHNIDKCQKNTIFTIDGCNPAKGVFHLINALYLVKKAIPDVKLKIPGRIPTGSPRFLRESPYYTYLNKLIKKLELSDNVEFLGMLSRAQMQEQLMSCNVFVMPSAIENHSSSLREAMYLGVPCVTALVGSVDEFTEYGSNALTYRYEDEIKLSECIIKVLLDNTLASKLGSGAYSSIRKKYPQDELNNKLYKIYNEVLHE